MKYLVLLLLIILTTPQGILWADSELPVLGDNARFNLQREVSLGQGLYDRLEQAGYIIDEPLLTRYLSDIGESLLSQLDLRLRRYRFFLVKDHGVNAFAAPGGFVGVNVGLVEMTKTEDELASVLAHEISHVELSHTMQMIEKAESVNTAGMLSLLAAILVSSQAPDLAAAMVYTSAAGSNQAIVNFTRTNEYEADRVGVELLKKSPYDERAMADFMEILQQKEQSGELANLEYLRTHPISSNRVAEARARVKGNPNKTPYKSRYDQFKDYLSFLYPGTGSGKGVTLFARALEQMRQGRYEKAQSMLQELIAGDPDSIWFRYALSESLLRQQRYAEAAKIYHSLLLLYPDDLAILARQTETLILQQQYDKALDLATRMVDLDDSDITAYRSLVRLYELTGNELRKQLSEANYHWFSGNDKMAVKLYQVLLEEGKLDVLTEQKVRQKLDENKLKKKE